MRINRSYLMAGLMEVAAMRIYAGLRETNMIQFMLSDQMHMDFIDWAEEYGQRFRNIYEENAEIKQAIDSGKINPTLIAQIEMMLHQ